MSEETKNTFTDSRDGRIYKTVKIGKGIWMAENLNYDAPGSKFCDNDPKNGEKYGRLYDFKTANEACPPGWRLPNRPDFIGLYNFAGNKEAGKHLKATSGWNTYEGQSGNGLDTCGFTALPGIDGYSRGEWWFDTHREETSLYHCIMRIVAHQDDIYMNEHSITGRDDVGSRLFLSVRCIQIGSGGW